MCGLRSWARYLARTPIHPQWLLGPRILPSSLAQATGRILDIGSADRWIEGRLSRDASYIALDYPPTGREIYHGRPTVFGDGARLPFTDDCFDGVVCFEVLEHVRDPGCVMNEIRRVLRSGGRAWISMPFIYPLHDAPHDFQRFTAYGLKRDVERAGLEVESLIGHGDAIRTAGLLASLAIAGGVATQHAWYKWILILPATLAVLAINMGAWVTSHLWPDWDHMAMVYVLEVRKP